MNAEVATLVAYRPADGVRMRTNSILRDLEAELRAARVEFPVRDRKPGTGDPAIRAAKSAARVAEQVLAVERAAARLAKIGAV